MGKVSSLPPGLGRFELASQHACHELCNHRQAVPWLSLSLLTCKTETVVPTLGG